MGDVQCDSTSSCPDNTTCCKLSGGQGWGCCPMPSATCCSDGVHCCPSGYTCDVSAGTCTKSGNEAIAIFTKSPAKVKEAEPVKATVKDVQCDSTSSCPDNYTCCKLADGQYGCCPLPSAPCCSDHVHCCPSGYTCDVAGGTCTKGSHVLALFAKVPAKKLN